MNLELDDPLGLSAVEQTETVSSLSLTLRWWQPFELVRAFLHDRSWSRLRLLSFQTTAELDAEALVLLCTPRSAELHVLDLGTPIGDYALEALVARGVIARLTALRLWDADLHEAGVSILATVARQLDELPLSGRSLSCPEAERLTSACRAGAKLTLPVHGTVEERMGL